MRSRYSAYVLKDEKYLYVDNRDNFYRVDPGNGVARIRFKLFNEAEPGPWRIIGYMENGVQPSERSTLYTKPCTVLSELEVKKRLLEFERELMELRNKTRLARERAETKKTATDRHG